MQTELGAGNLRFRKKVFLYLLCFFFFSMIPLPSIPDEEQTDSKISGFRFYLTEDDGKQKGVVAGTKADFLSPDEIEITDAKAEILDLKNPLLVQTPKCTFYKSKGQMVSSLPVTIKTIGAEINGIGMLWSFEEKKITIKKDVLVDIARNMRKELVDATNQKK
jgi:hypothetical protein